MDARLHEWTERVARERLAKDDYFRTSLDSPIPAESRAQFGGLSYFEPDPRFRFPALPLTPSAAGDPIVLSVSRGAPRRYHRAGQFRLTVGPAIVSLTAYRVGPPDDPAPLFVPFRDGTTGTETYAGGRYLDVERDAAGRYEVDFNLAYHPYCLYNPKYSCPIPPEENRLGVGIRAGERLPTVHPPTP
ncbi:MAG TPA: DUF1684 domain-containing protein [Thermoplasmata archaeon]|nr:DUF1684 domain-containing protein [Thermoplasmata archaeon]